MEFPRQEYWSGWVQSLVGELRSNKLHGQKINEKKKTKSAQVQGFPGGSVVKNSLANARDMGLIPGSGRSHMPGSN